jgi:hypothetical protein
MAGSIASSRNFEKSISKTAPSDFNDSTLACCPRSSR